MPPELFTEQPDFGALLRAQRIACGLTQAELAERAGLSVRGLSDLERGARGRPQRETLRRLLAALQVDQAARTALLRAARAAPPPVPAKREAASTVGASRPPRASGTLWGRQDEIAMLRTWLLEAEPGIITLTGPGGAGKTRLALEVAADSEVTARYADGVVFVDLSAVHEPELVLPAVAVGLGWAGSSGQITAQGLADRLHGQRVLVILDNCEQVVAAAPLVARVAALLPGVAWLATSREPLAVRAERCLAVSLLPLPAAGETRMGEVMASPAARLFLERAQAAASHFAVTPANAGDVAALCHRLDGLPLAIELAASLMVTHSPASLLRHVSEDKPLAGALRDLPPRQRSLHHLIAWSEDLLAPAEQRLFHLLGVFAGGFSLEAVSAVWEATRSSDLLRDDSGDVEALLGSLVRRSLVLRDETGEPPRFRMLETIRAYCAARLRDQPFWLQAAAAHAAAMHRAATEADLDRRDASFDARLRALASELPNLRSAIAWLHEHDPAENLRLLVTLGRFWPLYGQGAEGLAYYEQALERYTGQDLLRCQVARLAAWIAMNLGDFPRAEQHLRESEALIAASPDAREAAHIAFVRGHIAQGQADFAAAEASLQEALQTFQALDEPWAAFATQAALAMGALDRGEADLAEERYLAALQAIEPDGAARDRAAVLGNIAVAQRWQGKLDAAVTSAARALAATEGVVAWPARAGALQVLGRVALQEGDLPAARAWLADSLRNWQRSGDQRGLATSLDAVAAAATTGGEPGPAATLLGAVAALRERLGASISVYGAAEHADLEARLRAELGTTGFAVSAERGRLMSLSAALDLAYSLLDGSSDER